MRRIFIILAFLFSFVIGFSQTKGYLRYDTLYIQGQTNGELVLLNGTKNIPGFLFNTGNGRTIFKHPVTKLNDSTYLIGTDTLKTGSGSASRKSFSAVYPLLYDSTTGIFSIQQANGSYSGYLSNTDWLTFQGKQNQITWNDVTAGSARVTLGGTPVGSVRFPFSVDVNEANLILSNMSGTLPISKGGTGAIAQIQALNNLLPVQTGNAGKVLQTDGTGNVIWAKVDTGTTTNTLDQIITNGGGFAANRTSSLSNFKWTFDSAKLFYKSHPNYTNSDSLVIIDLKTLKDSMTATRSLIPNVPVTSVNGQIGAVVINGSETKISSSSSIGVTGSGTTLSPYVLNFINPGSDTVIFYNNPSGGLGFPLTKVSNDTVYASKVFCVGCTIDSTTHPGALTWNISGGGSSSPYPIDSVLRVGNTSVNRSLIMNDGSANNYLTISPSTKYISIGDIGFAADGTFIELLNAGGQKINMHAQQGISLQLNTLVSGVAPTVLLSQAAHTSLTTNLYLPNSTGTDTISTLKDVRAAIGGLSSIPPLDSVLTYGDTSHNKSIIFVDGSNNPIAQINPSSHALQLGDINHSYGGALINLSGTDSIARIVAYKGLSLTGNSTGRPVFFATPAAGAYTDTLYSDTASANRADTIATKRWVRANFGSGGSTYSADESTLHLSGSTFSIKSTYTGQTSITTLGTIGTGTWQGTAIGTGYGGAPSGGTTGQVLTKNSGTNYDYSWQTPAGASHITGTYSSNQSITVSGTAAIYMIVVTPTSPLTSFQVGITSSGQEVVTNQYVSATSTVFLPAYYMNGNTTLYFQGITSSTQITIIPL